MLLLLLQPNRICKIHRARDTATASGDYQHLYCIYLLVFYYLQMLLATLQPQTTRCSYLVLYAQRSWKTSRASPALRSGYKYLSFFLLLTQVLLGLSFYFYFYFSTLFFHCSLFVLRQSESESKTKSLAARRDWRKGWKYCLLIDCLFYCTVRIIRYNLLCSYVEWQALPRIIVYFMTRATAPHLIPLKSPIEGDPARGPDTRCGLSLLC